MQANVSLSYLQDLGFAASDLVIPRWEGVQQCQAQVTASQVTFTIPYAGCGTVQKVSRPPAPPGARSSPWGPDPGAGGRG